MKDSKTIGQRSFRPWPENETRLAYAASIGLNASELINELLRDHLRARLETVRREQTAKLKTALAQPVP